MSPEHNLREQIPLYINGALTSDEKHAFETALKQDQELKREYLEFHEIESTFDRFEDVSGQHLEQIFKTILNNTQGINKMTDRTSPPVNPNLGTEASNQELKFTATREVKPEPEPDHATIINTASHKREAERESNIDDNTVIEVSEGTGLLSSSRFAWAIAAIQFVVLLAVVFYTTPITQNATTSGDAVGQISGVTTYNVVFADNATQKEIRELLVNLEIQVANGPTSIGLYTIFVKGSKEEATKTFNKLKNSNLILLVEPSFI